MRREIIKRYLQIIGCHETNSYDLFTGKAGVCLALFVASRCWKSSACDRLANEYLSEILKGVRHIKGTSLDTGLSGIGMMFNILVKHEMLEVGSDDFFMKLDAKIYKDLFDDSIPKSVSCTNGILGYFVYVISRLRMIYKDGSLLHRLHVAMFRKCINDISDLFPSYYKSTNADIHTSVLFEGPILFFLLGQGLSMNISTPQIRNVVNNWQYYIKSIYPFNNINRLSLGTSLYYLNRSLHYGWLEETARTMVYSVNFNELKDEIDDRILNINEGWFFFCVILYLSAGIVPKKHDKYKDILLTRREVVNIYANDFNNRIVNQEHDFDNCNLINGLSGIILLQALFPKAFKK